ncbi:probable amino acid permease 7 [Prosopis cineraria]|uniref:probable amino acid permease 7 n=1 Tax=Prosopis cineraria TaxID=364024 RepID=UPI00240F081C|nr:probable amino acid permease 7 [Prosopis cineraria]
MITEEAICQRPFIESSLPSSNVTQEPPRRTGKVGSAVAHIITAVIGAGVLSLAWSIAQLGWLAGPISILLFAVTTLISSFLLSDCYRFPHSHGSIRNSTYMHAVKLYLGELTLTRLFKV